MKIYPAILLAGLLAAVPAGAVDLEAPGETGAAGVHEQEALNKEAVRDPFDEPKNKIFAADYGQVARMILLRGIVKMGEQQQGLFLFPGEEAGGGGGESGDLRRVGIGERVRVYYNDSEYLFTVGKFGNRSANLIGENGKTYKVWL